MASAHGSSILRTRSVRVAAASTNRTTTVASTSSSRTTSTSNTSALGGPASTTAPTSTTHHPPQPASAVSNLSLFLTNLRLLDLDLEPDWPDISALTFSNKDGAQGQKKRIQCVEWALYQLFALWDPDEARAKLQPFFPPLDQVQSLNLRAALLRSLEQAKKTGVLGRDAVVRKTMLDECRGERLEEVLAVLSSAVLKKLVAEQRLNDQDVGYPALAETMALENRGYAGERTQLAVLALAHRASLTRVLQEKNAARAQYKDFEVLMDGKERSLVRRLEQIKVAEQAARKKNKSEQVSDDMKLDVWRTVRTNWSGNERWMEALLYGDTHSKKDGVLSAPFDRVWRRVPSNRLAELEDRSGGLLEQLDARVNLQKERLEKWKGFRQKILGDTNAENTTRAAEQKPHQKGIDLGFRLHENLRIGRMSPRKLPARPRNLGGDYDELLAGLDAALGKITKGSGLPLGGLRMAHKSPEEERRTSAGASEAVSEFSDLEEEPVPAHKSHSRQASAATLDLGPSFEPVLRKSRTMEPEPSRLYKREPRSLRPQRPPISHNNSSSSSQRSKPTSPTRLKPASPPRSPERPSISPPPPPASPLRRTPSPVKSKPPSPERIVSPTQQLADQILASMNATSPSPVKKPRHTLSLAERTRLSMARRTSRVTKTGHDGDGEHHEDMDDEFDALPLRRGPTVTIDTAVDTNRQAAQHNNSINISGGDHLDEDDDLLARTRRSMVGFEAARQKAQLDRRRSQRKSAAAARQLGNHGQGHRREGSSYFPAVDERFDDEEGNTTLLAEELMSAGQDDYEAVFMSRPKIKTSPLNTPVKGVRSEEF